MIVMLQKGFQSMFQQKTLSFKKNPQFQQTQIILPPHNQSHRDIIHLSNRQCQDKLKKQKLKMINLINLQLFCLVDSSGAHETDIQLFHVLHFINIICILSTQSAQDTLVECHLDFTIKKIQELNKKYPSIDAQTYEQIIHLSNIFSTVTRAQIYSFFGKILCKYGKKLKAILPYYYEHFLLAYEKEQFFADHIKVSTSDIKDYLKRLLPIKNKLKQLCTFTT